MMQSCNNSGNLDHSWDQTRERKKRHKITCTIIIIIVIMHCDHEWVYILPCLAVAYVNHTLCCNGRKNESGEEGKR